MNAFTSFALRDEVDTSGVSVLIIDDSIVARASLGRMVEATSRFAVAGAVGSVAAALDFLKRHRVDIILLDLELPGTHGLTGLPHLLLAGQGAKVLVVSSAVGDGAVASIQALALGAADTLFKPEIGGFARQFGYLLESRLLRLVDGDVPLAPQVPTPLAAVLPTVGAFDIVAIGASTGGIHALTTLLRALPPSFDQPIVITQHLPASFMPFFAAQLTLVAGRPCDVAEHRKPIAPGSITIAPGTAHLCVARSGDGVSVRLTDETVVSGCLPSVDPMFNSVASAFGARAMGVVLSGMGRDGAVGACALADAGASIVVQDSSSSVVWGMPGAIANSGLADAILSPAEIGRLIATRAMQS